MSDSVKTVTFKRPLVSGLLGYLLFAGVVTYGFISAVINDYPSLPILSLLVWLLMPIFFINKELTLKVEDARFSVIKAFNLFGYLFDKEEISVDKAKVSIEERKHLRKKFITVTGADLEVQLFGIKGTQYDYAKHILD